MFRLYQLDVLCFHQNLVNHMHHAIGGFNIGFDQVGVIHCKLTCGDMDIQVQIAHGRGLGKGSQIAHYGFAGYKMIESKATCCPLILKKCLLFVFGKLRYGFVGGQEEGIGTILIQLIR